MAQLQLWVVHNANQDLVYVTKGKKLAVRIATLMNKTYTLLGSTTNVTCDSLISFFPEHKFNKSNIYFCWQASLVDKSTCYKLLVRLNPNEKLL